MIKTVNRQLATTPPIVDKLEEKRSLGGLMLPSQKTTLLELTLVYGYEMNNKLYKKGSKVLISGENIGFDFARKVYSFQNDHFVLIPEDKVIAIKESDNE